MTAGRYNLRHMGFSLALGCVAGFYILPPAALPWGAIVFSGVSLALFCIRRYRHIALLTLACAAGIAGIWLQTALFYTPAWESDGKMLEITATAKEDAVMLGKGQRVIVKWEDYNAQLYTYDTGAHISAGDTVEAYVYAVAEHNSNYALRMTAKGDIRVTSPEKLSIAYYPRVWARMLSKRLDDILDAHTAAVVRSIILGDKSGLSERDYDALSESGLAHTAAVSGLHVSTLAGFLLLLTKRRRRLSLLALPLIVLFVLVAGCPASAVRAGVMHGSMLLAGALGRDENPLGALELALAGILLINPTAISDIGLQLSFTSALGICLYAKKLEQWFLLRLPSARGISWLLEIFASSLSPTLTALMFSTPIAAAQFGKVSIISPVSNLLCLWAVTWLFICGLIALAVSLVYLPAARLADWVLTPLAEYFLHMAKWMSGIPYASVYREQVLVVLWLVLAYALIILFLLSKREKMRPWVLTSLLSGTLAAVLIYMTVSVSSNRIEISVLEAERGQSVLVTSGRQSALIDSGGTAARTASDALRAKGLSGVEYVILTGADNNYTAGINGLRERVNVRNLLMPAPQGFTEEIVVDSYVTLPLGKAVLYVLHLPAGSDESGDKLCVFVRSGDFFVAVAGDLEGEDERALLRLYNIPEAEVLISGVSASAVSEEWLAAVNPQTVIIPTVGEEPLARIVLSGARAYQSDICGETTIAIDN